MEKRESITIKEIMDGGYSTMIKLDVFNAKRHQYVEVLVPDKTMTLHEINNYIGSYFFGISDDDTCVYCIGINSYVEQLN